MIMPISRQTSIEWAASIKQQLASTPRVAVKLSVFCTPASAVLLNKFNL